MKGKIRINADLCKGCTYCINACPLGVITIGKGFNKNGYFPAVAVNLDNCTGCAMCASMCPEIAIEVYRNSGPKTRRASKQRR